MILPSKTMAALAAFLFFATPSFANDGDNLEKVNKLMDSIVAGQVLAPKAWTNDYFTQSVDVNELAKTDYPNGIVYGAVASKILKAKFPEVRAVLKRPGGIFTFASVVETQRNLVKIKETPTSLSVRLAIKVPIVADILTQDEVKIIREEKDGGVLEWRQIGDEGDLVYNRGDVVLKADGDNCRILVVGVHVIKEARKVPWIGRGTAAAFAKTHYANYIKAVETVLAPKE